MSVLESYLSNGSSEGNRNRDLFKAACQSRDNGNSLDKSLLLLVDRAVTDGLSSAEAHRTLHSVYDRPAREPADAKAPSPPHRKLAPVRGNSSSWIAPINLRKDQSRGMPPPMEGPITGFLRAAFNPGECIRIVNSVREKDSREVPQGRGETVPLEEWLDRIDDYFGCVDDILPSPGVGAYVAVNPLKRNGSKDSEVTALRHVLVEFDDEPLETQWALINNSQLPVTAVIYSGSKSLHAWVRVDAPDREEYNKRRELVYGYFKNYRLDECNKNPGRLSRLPGASRGSRKQDLLSLKLGSRNWDEWVELMEDKTMGETIRLADLAGLDPGKDPDCLLGRRWLCRGGSCVISGQTGIGKSSLAMQMSMLWALGSEAFGVKPVRPLKSLIIQAENDAGDLAEQVNGVINVIAQDQGDRELINENVIVIRSTDHTGEDFCKMIEPLIKRHKPDLCWVDPLFSYVGGDVCRQDVCSRFLRNGLNPISVMTGVVWMIVHHTNKPSDRDLSGADMSYDMFGSSELANWARAVCVLRDNHGEGYLLHFAKRGERAGGATTQMLRHSSEGVFWEEAHPQFTVSPDVYAD